MARFRMLKGELVPLTAEEEAARDLEEAAWAAGQAERDAKKAEEDYENDPDMPTLKEKVDALLVGGGLLAEVKGRVDAVKSKHGR